MNAYPFPIFRGLTKWFLVACLGIAGWLPRASAQTQDDVTVAFLYNFARFVEWPATAFGDGSTPFVIGFVGRPALADKFGQAVQGKNVNGREFSVRKLDSAGAGASCQIVFIGGSDAADAVGALKGKPVLIVGEGEDFLRAGGMIAFSREGARLVFDVNPKAIAGASLRPGEKLTKAARAQKGG